MTQGPGWEALRLADLPEAPAGPALDADGAAAHRIARLPATGRWRASRLLNKTGSTNGFAPTWRSSRAATWDW